MSQQRRLTSCALQKKSFCLLHITIFHSTFSLTLPGKCPHSLDVAADCIPCVQCACTMARFEKHRPIFFKLEKDLLFDSMLTITVGTHPSILMDMDPFQRVWYNTVPYSLIHQFSKSPFKYSQFFYQAQILGWDR